MEDATLLDSLHDVWASRLEKKPVRLDGEITIDLSGRTAVYRPVDGEEKQVVLVSQDAISTVLRSGRSRVESGTLVASLVYIRIREVRQLTPEVLEFWRVDALYDELFALEVDAYQNNDYRMYDQLVAQMDGEGLPLDRPQPEEGAVTVEHHVEHLGVYREEDTPPNLPDFSAIIDDLSLDAALSWRALDLVRRALDGAMSDPDESLRRLDAIRDDAPDDERVLGLMPNQISARIGAAAEQAGLGIGYSGESPRLGMLKDLEELGAVLLGERIEDRGFPDGAGV